MDETKAVITSVYLGLLLIQSKEQDAYLCMGIITGTVNTGVNAAPFCSKFFYQIGDAAYLHERLDVNLHNLTLLTKNFTICIDLCSKIIRNFIN